MENFIFNSTISIIGIKKDNKRYCGTYAWSSQVGYNEVTILIGAQSVTGDNIKEKDIIGLSVLSKEQKDLALMVGDCHSDKVDKLKDVEINEYESAITVKNAKKEIVVEVIKIIHLEGLEEDRLVYCKVIKSIENKNVDFLLASDIYC